MAVFHQVKLKTIFLAPRFEVLYSPRVNRTCEIIYVYTVRVIGLIVLKFLAGEQGLIK